MESPKFDDSDFLRVEIYRQLLQDSSVSGDSVLLEILKTKKREAYDRIFASHPDELRAAAQNGNTRLQCALRKVFGGI